MIEATNQLTDFVLRGNGQGRRRLAAVRQGRQRSGGNQHGGKLASEHPPGQATRQQGQGECSQQHALLHGANRGKGFFGRQRNCHVPSRHGYAFGRSQHFHTKRIDSNARTLETRNKPVNQRVDAGGRECFHDAAFVGGGNHQPQLRRDQQVATGLAVDISRQFVEKVWFAQIDHPGQGANHLTLGIANWCRHGDHRRLQHLADGRLADRRLALFERGGNVIPEQVIDADPFRRERHIGNRGAIAAGDEGACIEIAVQDKPLLKKFLQGRRIVQQARVDGAGDQFQRIDAVFQLVVDLCRHKRYRRELLFAQKVFHIVAQHPADIERQQPDADQEDGEGEQGHPGLE